MRVFLSFADQDAGLAAQLEAALQRLSIETYSSLDVPSREEWKQLINREGEKADGFVFLVGTGSPVTPQLETEWRLLLRNDWDGTKILIPVIPPSNQAHDQLRPFLRSRKPVYLTSLDTAADQVRYFLEHPKENLDPVSVQQARIRSEEHRKEMEEYVLALKEQSRRNKAALR